MDLLALSNSAANFLLYFAMSSQVTIWLSPITFDLFSLFCLVWLGCWYIRQMDPPPLLHPWCILSWNSRNLSKQLLFDSGSSSPGAVFLLPVDLGLGAAVGGMRLEINTGCSCYSICNNSRHKMALQSITKLNSYSSFSDILVFVCLCLCLAPCICHCICLSYLCYGFHDIFPKLRNCPTQNLQLVKLET